MLMHYWISDIACFSDGIYREFRKSLVISAFFVRGKSTACPPGVLHHRSMLLPNIIPSYIYIYLPHWTHKFVRYFVHDFAVKDNVVFRHSFTGTKLHQITTLRNSTRSSWPRCLNRITSIHYSVRSSRI